MNREINRMVALSIVSLFSIVILIVVLYYGEKQVTATVFTGAGFPTN